MENEIEKILEVAQGIKMGDIEKEGVRNFLVLHAKNNKRKHGFWIFSNFRLVSAFFILLVIFGCVGISSAAEKALPGDVLYPVKTGVNEKIRGLFAVSDEAQVKWLADTSEQRIVEAEKLAGENRLNYETRKNVEKNLEEKTKKIQEKLNSISGKKNLKAAQDARQNLEDSLGRHEEILTRLSEKEDESKIEVKSVLENVKSFRKSIRAERSRREGDD